MLKKILIVVVVVVLGAVGFVASRPDTYHVERSITIGAPAVVVFDRINGFAGWEAWSPWAKLDPAMKPTLSGPASGVGARYAWDSPQDNVGAGEMTITESKPGEKVVIDLHFMRPFEDRNVTTFTMKPAPADAAATAASAATGRAGEGTAVTWAMDGHNNLVSKTMGVFMNMDALIGADFDKGLAQLQVAAEADAVTRAAAEAAARKSAAIAALPGDGEAPVPQQ